MKMKYVTVRSGLETVEGAYLGQFVSNGTSFLDDITGKMCEGRPAVDEPEARLAIRAIAAEIREKVGEGLFRVNAGDVSFEPAISGSLPAMDSALSEDNHLYVNIVASDAIKMAIGSIVPTRDSSSAVKVSIDNIEDLATHGRLIVGTHEFVVTGRNLSASLEGEGMVLLRTDGSVATAVTVCEGDGMGQRINAQLAASVPAGTYLLQVTTRGYATPDAEAESYTKRVVVEAGSEPTPPANPPTATSYIADEMEGEPIYISNGTLVVNGTNLAGATKIEFSYAEGGEAFYEIPVTTATETSAEGSTAYGGTLTAQSGYLRVVTPHGTTNELACQFTE